MKPLSDYTFNTLRIKPNDDPYQYHPKSRDELRAIIEEKLQENTEELNLTDVDVSNITDMSKLFEDLQSVKRINCEDWNTSKVTDMWHLFYNCFKLEEINVRGWDVSNVEDMTGLFMFCSNLKRIYGIEKWKTSSLKRAVSIFNRCVNLTEIDLSSWDSINIEYTNFMFLRCVKLKDIYGLEYWETPNLKNYRDMFEGCKKLNPKSYNMWPSQFKTQYEIKFMKVK